MINIVDFHDVQRRFQDAECDQRELSVTPQTENN